MNPIQYLNDTVFCKLGNSPIHGVGVFAIRDIPEGTSLTDYTISNAEETRWLYLKPEEFDQVLPEIRALILDRNTFDERTEYLKFLSPNRTMLLRAFMNHADDANSDGLTATRFIREGDEITDNFTKGMTCPHELTREHHPYAW